MIKNWFRQNSFKLILGIVLGILGMKIEETNITGSMTLFRLLFFYASIFILSTLLPKHKFFEIIKGIISIPFIILSFLMPLSQTIFLIIVGFIMPFMLFSCCFIYFPEIINIDLNRQSKIYLVFTLSSIFILLFSEKLIARMNRSQHIFKPEERESKQLEFSMMFANKNIARFFIYVFYFLLLIISSVSTLNKFEMFEMKDLMAPILMSFTTFIAFERILNNINIPRLSLKELLIKYDEVIKTYRL